MFISIANKKNISMNHSKRTYRTKKITTFAAIAYVLLTGTAVFAMDGDDDHRTSAEVSPTASPAADPSLEQEEPKAGTHGLPVHHAVRLSANFSSDKWDFPEFFANFTLPNGKTIALTTIVNNQTIEISNDITFLGNEIKIPFLINSPYGGEVQKGVWKALIEKDQKIEKIELYFKWNGRNNKEDPPWFD